LGREEKSLNSKESERASEKLTFEAKNEEREREREREREKMKNIQRM
jgi:hypothetical protein